MDGGAPVVASNTGGCRELVEDYGGVTFEVDDVIDLQEKLQTAIASLPVRHRPDLSAHYIENTNKAMVDFYRKALSHRDSIESAW